MVTPNFVTRHEGLTQNYGKFIIEPLPTSFGHSLGNSLRRSLLASLKGTAITGVKIDGADHIFETLPGIRESALDLILNLKQLRFKSTGEGPFKVKLEVKGAKKLYGKDVEGEAEVVNKDLYLGEITDPKKKLEIEMKVEVGYGYAASEDIENKESGYIAVDAFFSPIKKVNFKVEEARVGRKSNLDRLILEVWTDGSINPEEAVRQAAVELSEYFKFILSGQDTPENKVEKTGEELKQEEIDRKLYEVIIDELNLPSRVINALLRENIETVADLIKAGREKLTTMKGVGKKSIELIEAELKKMGLQLS